VLSRRRRKRPDAAQTNAEAAELADHANTDCGEVVTNAAGAARCLRGARAVIFDNDGVLVDSEPISLLAYRNAIWEQGVQLAEEDDERYCGLTDTDIIKDMEQVYGRGLDLARFQERKRTLYFEYAKEQPLPAFEGVREFVQALRAAGVPYILASSGSREKIGFNLGRAGIVDLFPAIVSGEDFHRGKPDPEIFLKSAEKLGVHPSECVVVEDSINGLKAARAAGTIAVGITNTFRREQLEPHADLVVDTLSELRAAMPRR
jgi:HAD superfamily hydrolase (TIGR01509 family)